MPNRCASAYLSLDVESDAEAERIFSALSDGGEVFIPMQETLFATRFGQLRDRLGINLPGDLLRRNVEEQFAERLWHLGLGVVTGRQIVE